MVVIWCPVLLSVLNQNWNVSIIFRETLQYQFFRDVTCRQTGEHGEANKHTFTTKLTYSSYLTVNTLRLHYKDQPVNTVYGIVAVYSEDHTKHKNTLHGQIVFISFKIYSNRTDIMSS